MTIRTFPAAFLAAVILTASALTVAAFAACPPSTPHPPRYAASQVGAEVCFPFASWSAWSVDNAPCYTVPHPQEDGSGAIYVGTVANDLAVCVIPNVQEERGHFAAQCHRLSRGDH